MINVQFIASYIHNLWVWGDSPAGKGKGKSTGETINQKKLADGKTKVNRQFNLLNSRV